MNNMADLSEKDLMNDLLTSEKQIIGAYSTGITESSCTNFRNVLIDNFKRDQEVQYKVFDAMHKKGWYPTKDAAEQDVQQLKSQSQQMMNELK
ncbi:spore coat protein [Hathewaya limosa]|uniref:Spore coat protein CotF n=1 Tax=Hathewaya limosa TaxID=1536 RepID=A0ABU0JQG9_HATLI|nr:spore coat protein [Hathewaya limosa]AWZ48035.1 spore coat protein [Clostridiaceae bacterium 14S0207]MDQ0479346.1 spore coat protein CotF [Hathewaya limosa]